MSKSGLLILLLVLIGGVMQFISPPHILDARLYYTGDQARDLFANFSAQEKQSYFYNELLDLFFLTIYSSLFLLWTKQLLPKRFSWLALIPGFFDLIETSVILFATQSKAANGFFDQLGYVTFLKWSTGTILAASLIYRRFRAPAKP